MYNEPEWASNDEWDAYAWFGFAIAEAQAVERLLLVIAVAIKKTESHAAKDDRLRSDLYEQLGHWTLGRLCTYVGGYEVLNKEILEMLQRVVTARNALAHEFFVPVGVERPPLKAKKELQKVASLFSHVSTVLESNIWPLLEKLEVQHEALLLHDSRFDNAYIRLAGSMVFSVTDVRDYSTTHAPNPRRVSGVPENLSTARQFVREISLH